MNNIKARRKTLVGKKPSSTTHAGLWLDRYLEEQIHKKDSGDKGERSKHFDALFAPVIGTASPTITVSKPYEAAFNRWKDIVGGHPYLEGRTATVVGRMIVGLGSESVWENSIRLHHTYGVPVIPGSSLKGLAARYAADYLGTDWSRDSATHQAMFGTTEQSGAITFYDAWYKPTTDGKLPLLADVITVHHKQYYGYSDTGEPPPPADWDSPTPIQFLSANGSYIITLGGVEAWRNRAFEILTLALEHEGIGAKTSSGYGRMVLAMLDQGG